MAIYGVTFDGIRSAGTRTDDAVGMVWEKSTNAVAGRDDFASLSPFNVKECVTKYNSETGKREVLGYKGDTGYDTLRADTTNDIMIEFPCFWYQRPSKYTWRISDKPVVGFKPSPMHYHTGKLYKNMRVSKYAVDDNYMSRVSTYPRVSTDINTFRTNLRAKGMNMIDYPTWCSIVMLSLVKYANMNIQSTIGQGGYSVSGSSNNVLGLDGSSVTNSSVVTHGIENVYNNVWKYMDGIFCYGNNLYYKDVEQVGSNPASSSELVSSYTKISTKYVVGTDNQKISNIAYDNFYDFGVFPISGGEYYPTDDSMWTQDTFGVYIVGGSSYSGSGCGLFAVCTRPMDYTEVDAGTLSLEFGEQYPQKQLYIASDNKVYAMMSE